MLYCAIFYSHLRSLLFFRKIAIGVGRELRTFNPDAALIMGWQEL